jgi:N-acetylmuramoyl-L-alanine amidase
VRSCGGFIPNLGRMCDDHLQPTANPTTATTSPGSRTSEHFGRRSFLGRVALAPFAVPAVLTATGAMAPAASAAEVKIRSKACSAATTATPIPSSKTLIDLMTKQGVTVHPRADWAGKLAAKGPLQAETPRFLLVHHTVSSNTYAETAVADQIRGFFNFHTGDKGWNDVAYNFFIDRFGGVWEARTGSLAGPVRGDATGGNQGFSQLVCMVGDFTTLQPLPAAVDSLSRVLAALADKYGIDTSPGATTSFVSRKSNRWKAGLCVETPTIAGHREMSQTACPGDALFAIVRDELPARVAKARRA